MSLIGRLFTHHPDAVGESYFEHMAFAFRFGGRLLRASCAAFAHGFVPGLCETTASTTILDMHDEIRARRIAMAKAASNAPGSTAQTA